MSYDSENPYVSPAAASSLEAVADTSKDELAGRFTRFAAVFVDGILIMIVLIPAQMWSGIFERVKTQQASLIEQIAISLFSMMVMLIYNGYFLLTRGQTIGKMLAKIQIVDFESGRLLPFSRVYVYRYLWTLPFAIVAMIIPGQADDAVLNILVLVDAVFIFADNRRCLHDFIAGSKVVLYKPNRPHLV